jgi:hypothetical protein
VRVGVWQLEEGKLPKWVRPKPFNGPADLLVQNTVFLSSPFRRKVWQEVGDFDDSISWCDWDFWTRAILRYGWKWNTCNSPLFYYRKHPSQMSQESYTKKWDELIEYMRSKYADDLKRQQLKQGYGGWK